MVKLTPETMPAWLLEKKAEEAAAAAARAAAELDPDVEIVGERSAVESAADRLRAAEARGAVTELSDDEGDAPRPRRLLTLRQRSERAEACAAAVLCAAAEAEEALTLDELLARDDADKRAAKRATRHVLRRLA